MSCKTHQGFAIIEIDFLVENSSWSTRDHFSRAIKLLILWDVYICFPTKNDSSLNLFFSLVQLSRKHSFVNEFLVSVFFLFCFHLACWRSCSRKLATMKSFLLEKLFNEILTNEFRELLDTWCRLHVMFINENWCLELTSISTFEVNI